MNRNLKIADSMLDLIGWIPLVRLNRIGQQTGAEILVKPEFLNPSGSMKDRVALRMVEEAEAAGELTPGTRIVESTTGNTGAALAFVAAVKGYEFTAFVPSDVADAGRMKIMQAFGARFTPFAIDGELGDLAGRRQCLDLTETETGVWWSRQFSNPHNVAVHRETTAKEIIEKTDGRLDAFVASVGSGGNLLGVGQALKEHDPNIRVIGVEPDSWRVLSAEHLPVVAGLSGGTSAALRESGIVDEVITLDDATAIQMAHRLAQEEGMFCGISSGANVAAAVMAAERLGAGKRIVTCLCDSRDRYFFNEAYVT
ncbi:MAG TPA: cysteine synthase family protein [Blastocatellia bacterium]|nr:cysteine synthase family protein [Blastocatellia bacterium]HMZ19221.1 cysteine synthase family protein [Blastocatellia bacterium]HNG33619.1 cysteine synthase family protein [Blastocatellia bacterium]